MFSTDDIDAIFMACAAALHCTAEMEAEGKLAIVNLHGTPTQFDSTWYKRVSDLLDQVVRHG